MQVTLCNTSIQNNDIDFAYVSHVLVMEDKNIEMFILKGFNGS